MSMGFSLPCTRTRGALLVVMCRSLPPSSIIFFSNSLSVIPDMVIPSLQHSFANYFFNRREAQADLDQSASAQHDHSLVDGLFLQFQRGSAHQNQFPQLVVDLHDFVKADAALVPGLVA